MRILWALFLIAVLPVIAQEARPYTPEIDAKAALTASLNQAQAKGRHVWVQISDVSCPLCERLHWFIEAHPETSERLRQEFIPLHPAVSRQNIPLFRQWGSPQLEHGVPVILILDAEGGILAISPVKSLTDETGDFSEKKITEFMKQWSPESVKQRAADVGKEKAARIK